MSRRNEIVIPELCDWLRSLPCAFCYNLPPAYEPGMRIHVHHYPPKGRLGYADDTRAVPACAACHARCEGQTVVLGSGTAFERRLGPISDVEQEAAAGRTFRRMLEEAPPAVVSAALQAISARRESVPVVVRW